MKKILLLENDRLLKDLYFEVVSGAGFEVDTADNGEDGILQIRKSFYHLLLLDILLPKIDGFDMLILLKKENLIKRIKTIFVISNISAEVVVRNKKRRIEADEYFLKCHLTPDLLLAKINSYLNKQKVC